MLTRRMGITRLKLLKLSSISFRKGFTAMDKRPSSLVHPRCLYQDCLKFA